jgi:DNA repair exonuclease SbcCD ATPase subunit
MDPVLRSLLIARLKTSGLDPAAAELVETACGPPRGGAGVEPAWLRAVAVEGFRGIGPPAELELAPEPGLTVIAGGNGSGKSSFAEGLELLLTGSVKRWVKRPKAWTDTWQCLHHDGPTRLRAELVCESGEDVVVEREWPAGARYEPFEPDHHWAGAVASFRPFLAYAELATMFTTLTSLFDALSPVLGLGDVDALVAGLRSRRLALEKRRQAVKARKSTLLLQLGDPRDTELREAIRRGRLEPDAGPLRPLPSRAEVHEALEQLESAYEEHGFAASPEAAHAAALATLLRGALAVREGDDCPVCGTRGALDGSLATRAARLEREAASLRTAESAVAAAERRARALLATASLDADRAGLADALRTLGEQTDSPLRGEVRAWLEESRAVRAEAGELAAVSAAEAWVKSVAAELRTERFAPVEQRALANWRQLRQGSSVDLRAITLRKLGRNGRADFGVSVDAEPANALGVMSQGELLSLSVSVFLPRAALEESPFRFAVIDDPVQSMDAAKVEGLAHVLHDAAATRQIVVFTHDDRLWDAIERRGLEATLVRVSRRTRSSVAAGARG